MARILLVYGTRQGQAAHIADRIATMLRPAHEVYLRDLRSDAVPSLAGYDAVIVGASVHAGGYEREVKKWVAAHHASLDAIPNAFFSVSLSAANHDAKSEAEMDAVIEKFVTQTGWHPQRVERFAGALRYTKYNWLLKRIMRRIVRHQSRDDFEDMTHDYELTDYDQVDAFAATLVDRLSSVST